MQKLAIIDEWMKDPEFVDLPLEKKRATLLNYFDTRLVDDDFKGLDDDFKTKVKDNFLNVHLGEEADKTEYHLKGAAKRIPYDVGSAMGGAIPHGIGILGEKAREYSDSLAQQPKAEPPYQPAGFPASRPPVSQGAQVSPGIPEDQFSPEKTQAKAQQLWGSLKTVGQENKDHILCPRGRSCPYRGHVP